MSSQAKNAEYFASRAVAERALSEAATDPRAAAIHAELADRYEELALEFSGRTVVALPASAGARRASAS